MDQFHAAAVACPCQQLGFQYAGFFPHIVFELLAQAGVFFNGLFDGLDDVRYVVEQEADFAQYVLAGVEAVIRRLGSHGFDAAHAGGNGAFGGDAQAAYHAGGGDVSAAAEFDGCAVFDHTHFFAVFLAKEGGCSQGFGFMDGHVAMFFERVVFAYLLIDEAFRLAQFLFRYFLEMREVEAEGFGGDVGAFLLHVVTQYFAQGFMQEMGGGVVTFALDAFPGMDGGGESACHVFRQTSG
ncbi:hypothetical protein Barb6_00108 [Bacteroidales bacterium Barb6]|nr:hypothetical protein Barb6_00108 [Bacteroidales bacterium Barb6]